uniref:Carbonic anhydrase n=1 Tax=Chromera velia CCMP2878 TaxID=1169474 RepID=A0A0G4FCR4_9ALVE|mmetsp:Transcript_38995/g.76652  ORF Transcript_38995/g.76652 Transcript_38995/m.76652 type:complete len:300 (+) Transcript_38995:272-1171(+)|eukprot:Cvel_16266.t1-p1 / transcript=Cvel_16266.t1 / gene=Cvel_16266 / organism=Chromera_velia_CCMP2878 / gene_product=Carbonic anhydrase, putative / transcript_product=Carbonic anhydrase, putative / location=Cvel_scaffold1245:20406-22091(+) / protein_length=299 / sequence_SO=supercontig / SO=protein_coding / is_pseudo=false
MLFRSLPSLCGNLLKAHGQSLQKVVTPSLGSLVDIPSYLRSAVPLSSTSKHVTRYDHELSDIMHKNKEWVSASPPEVFEQMERTQNPEIFYIGCCDARVPANVIMGLGANEVFVHRNVANLVVATDVNLLSAVQFAVNNLDIKHIMLTGHYDCGGVRASMKNQGTDSDLLDSWLRNLRDVYRIHKTELDGIGDLEERHRRLVQKNVVEQCLNLFKVGVVQKKRLFTYKRLMKVRKEGKVPEEAGIPNFVYPRIHAMVFNPGTGLLEKLHVDIRSELERLSSIYQLYEAEDGSVVSESRK